jgi:hypothetical protein
VGHYFFCLTTKYSWPVQIWKVSKLVSLNLQPVVSTLTFRIAELASDVLAQNLVGVTFQMGSEMTFQKYPLL